MYVVDAVAVSDPKLNDNGNESVGVPEVSELGLVLGLSFMVVMVVIAENETVIGSTASALTTVASGGVMVNVVASGFQVTVHGCPHKVAGILETVAVLLLL